MRRKDIEDVRDSRSWVELGRCEQHCPVCDTITLHIDYQKEILKKRGETAFARMCQNHCDIELDERFIDTVFKHEPTGLYIKFRFDIHHWGNMHRGPNADGTDPNHICYGYGMEAHTNKACKGYGKGGQAGPFNTNFYPKDFHAAPFHDRKRLKQYLLEWAYQKVTLRYEEHIPKEKRDQLTFL